MCGIFGAIAKEGYNIDIHKVKILGLFNVQRGTDSCGYYYSGNIAKGVGAQAVFSRFVVEKDLIRGDARHDIFLGHTRKATGGQHTEENAHPHQFDNFIQTHNGVIRNAWPLCRKYNVDDKGLFVDSMGLAKVINEHGFNVLGEYQGFAALAMTWAHEPENLFLFHGKSKEWESDKESKEERPLFILERPEALYYSSMEDSLKFISDPNDVAPYTLEHNIVFKVHKGIIVEQVFKTDREKANIPVFTPVLPLQAAQQGNIAWNNQTPLDKYHYSSVMRETVPKEFYNYNAVYYQYGRYFKDDHLLLNGEYFLNDKGQFDPKKKKCSKYYFIRGIMMQNKATYEKVLQMYPDAITNLRLNLSYFISRYSKYPITALPDEGSESPQSYRATWWKDSTAYDGRFTPLFTKREYECKTGTLTTVYKAYDEETIFKPTNAPVTFIPKIDAPAKKVDNKNALTPAKVEATSPINNEQTLLDVINLMDTWANKTIFPTDVASIPEAFLFLMDDIVSTIISNEAGIKPNDLSDYEIEGHSRTYLKGLITTGLTFAECLKEDNYAHLLNKVNIRRCFKPYTIEELVDPENRFCYLDFDEDYTPMVDVILSQAILKREEEAKKNPATNHPDIKQQLITTQNNTVVNDLDKYKEQFDEFEARLRFKELVAQLEEMSNIADQCIPLEYSEFAQEVCGDIHVAIGLIKEQLRDLTIKYNIPVLTKEVEKIKCQC